MMYVFRRPSTDFCTAVFANSVTEARAKVGEGMVFECAIELEDFQLNFIQGSVSQLPEIHRYRAA